MKNGVRNMRRWDTEIPVIRRERPDLQILTCHDEYLLHTMFDVDGALVGYGGLTPEPLIELIAAGKAKDYAEGARDPRPAAPGDAHRLSPRLAHGRNRRAQAWPGRARHPRARDRPLRRCCRSSRAPTSRSPNALRSAGLAAGKRLPIARGVARGICSSNGGARFRSAET